MRHLEPNIKVNEMKGKNKPISLIFISLLVLSALLTVAYVPNAASSPDVSFDAKISPRVVSGVYPPLSTKFTINVTGLSNTEPIVKVDVTCPSDWVYVSAQAPADWTAPTYDLETHTVTFSKDEGAAITEGTWKLFNVTVKVVSGFGKENIWTVTCTAETGASASKDLKVYVTPWFDATITPYLKKADETLWFEVKVKNNASESSINIVKITYPDTDGWQILDYTGPTGWTYTYTPPTPTITFTAPSGYEIAKGSYAIFKFKMTTGTPTSPTTKDYDWLIKCTNTLAATAEMSLKVKIDNTPPTVTVTDPNQTIWASGYSVGAGNYVWLNLTVTDDIEAMPSVYLNDTVHFTRYKVEHTTGTTTYKFCYVNTTAIPDGPLAVWFNVTDYVGNWISTTSPSGFPNKISACIKVNVDNTPPFIWINVEGGTPKDSTFWVGPDTPSVYVNVTVADFALEPIGPLTGIYVNGTRQTWGFSEKTGVTYKVYNVFESRNSLNLPLTGKCWVLFVNVTDKSRPHNHTSTIEVYIKRDFEKPTAPSFTIQPICGGAIIRNLVATDNVGIYAYRVLVNGTLITPEVLKTQLESTSLVSEDAWVAFSNVLVLKLPSDYADKIANITIVAVDYGSNIGPGTSKCVTIPKGEWYPIVLYSGWNLISLPLIPVSEARADVLSLILKQGPAGATVTYGFDNKAKSWIMNPANMTHGQGYWIYMKSYDVLIVQGTSIEEYWGLEPIHYLLYKGWNLVGYTAITPGSASEYLSSLEGGSYYKYVYVWKAEDQRWMMVKAIEPAGTLYPGQAFWIFLHSDQTLIPPVPTP
jgi:hypothetical protein